MSTGLIAGLIIIIALVRVGRSLFGRQALQRRRLQARFVLSAIVGLAFIALTASQMAVLAGELAGLVVGAGLGWLALRLTTFDRTEQGTFYRPNPYLSLGVLAVWVGRFLIRLIALAPTLTAASATGPRPTSLVADPLTGAAYLGLIAYFACYAGLLLRSA